MGAPPITTRLLADIREWASDPAAVVYRLGPVAILHADIVGKTDEQLAAFIRERRDEP
jgi:hypothetical protein